MKQRVLLGVIFVCGWQVALAHPSIISGTDEYEFTYKVQLPKDSKNVRMWVPVAQSDVSGSIPAAVRIGILTCGMFVGSPQVPYSCQPLECAAPRRAPVLHVGERHGRADRCCAEGH